MGNELIKKEDVLNLLYGFKDDDEIPQNYGTLLDIIHFVRVMPGIKTEHIHEIITEHIHELESRDAAKKPSIEGDRYAPDGTFIWDTWICPNCNEHYEIDYDEYDFCPKCGQRIDKSELE